MDLKILCFNIHKGMGWGNRTSTINKIKKHIFDLQSDFIMLQEVRGHQFEFLTKGAWQHISYGKNAVYQAGHHGNAIFSKYPITSSDNIDLSVTRYDKRGLLHSTINIPGYESTLHLLCLHLGLFAKARRNQLDIVVKYINSLPENEPIILGGDFNDWGVYATKPLVHKLGFQEAFLHKSKSYAKTYPAWMPILKLDRIYYRGLEFISAERLIKKPWKYFSDHIGLVVSLNIKMR